MLTKVSNRVRHRSSSTAQDNSTDSRIQAVTIAPDLLRWSDFTNPFPPVALGGYARYYASKTPKDTSAQTPNYCPALSQYPEAPSPSSPSRETQTLPKTSLFHFSSPTPSSPPLKPCLTIIHEASMESISPTKLPNLSFSVHATPASLRRRRRQLLRTPSIERDFAVNLRHIFSSTTLAVYDPSSISVDAPSSDHLSEHSRSLSSGSNSVDHSDESNRSEDSNHSDIYPITPTTSVDSREDNGGYGKFLVLGDTGAFDLSADYARMLKVDETTLERSGSRASFSTAKSGFSND